MSRQFDNLIRFSVRRLAPRTERYAASPTQQVIDTTTYSLVPHKSRTLADVRMSLLALGLAQCTKEKSSSVEYPGIRFRPRQQSFQRRAHRSAAT